jgi:hypothetical protein
MTIGDLNPSHPCHGFLPAYGSLPASSWSRSTNQPAVIVPRSVKIRKHHPKDKDYSGGIQGGKDVVADSPLAFFFILATFFFLCYLVDKVIHQTVL